ncbi:LbetaH domain-containing protein [Azospirillum isscasi]|uniref:C-methyltransferase domain-containing protein n=1 Tax=Azospirillum isscasi TaxID=3053926 RepID=A0ABU0WJP5_9PROT|nr:hypothetical protein [Azospirillum isscasi]MDQ2104243.1 hypothetical protein [Azospirillum isscasi]
MPPFHFIMVVWGERFTRFFLDVALPSQLASDGLPAMRHLDNAVYRIFTTESDAAVMTADPAFDRLSALMRVEFTVVEPGAEALLSADRYATMTAFHRRAVAEASVDGAYLVFLAPDAIFSAGTFAHVEARAALGDELVMIGGPRTVIEDAVPVVFARFRQPDGTISIPPRDLVRLMIDHPHPISKSLRWGTPGFCCAEASHLYWFASDNAAFVAHCWHLHPILVRSRPGSSAFSETIDGDYVLRTVQAPERIHVIQSSDEACVLEFSRRDHWAEVAGTPLPFSLERTLEWAAQRTNRFHRRFFDQPILFRAHGASEEAIEACLAEAEAAAAPIARAVAEQIADVDCAFDVRDLAGARHLYLYGCGRFGTTVLDVLRRSGVTVTAFIDSERDGTLDGLPILPFAAFRDDHPAGAVVLICSMFFTPIARKLEAVPDCRVLLARPLFNRAESGPLVELPLTRWTPTPSVQEALP